MVAINNCRDVWLSNPFSFILIFYPLLISSDVVFENQPRFLTHNGHLLIIAADGHNISLHSKNGYINLNGEDLSHLVVMARSAVNTVERFRMNTLTSLEEKIKDLNNKVNGPNGIINILNQKTHTTNISLDTENSVMDVSVSRRLSRLYRKVNGISSRVTYLMNLRYTDECASNPCQNGGTCSDLYGNFDCHCPSGWEGQLCTIDVNECARFYGTDLGCQNGAECVNKPGSYECICKSGWHGVHCRTQKNDCNTGNQAELCGHGVCVNQGGTTRGYVCICDQGWKKDTFGACVIDVDECALSKSVCSHDPPVQCINVIGSFFCGHCPAGYTGSGYDCADINECILNNGDCSLSPFVQCINTPGSRICGPCPPGYHGDGVKCAYAGGLCFSNNGGCHPNARCIENSENIQCICNNGFTGSGIGPNGCIPSTSTGGIVKAHPCTPTNPCKNLGICVMTGETSYLCLCRDLYQGTHCEISVNGCKPNPCQNGGSCSAPDQLGNFLGPPYKCVCLRGYTGINCEFGDRECGGKHIGYNGTIKFTEHSNNAAQNQYKGRRDCRWEILVNETLVVNVTFVSFNLDVSPKCKTDYITIHDGEGSDSRIVGSYCGRHLPSSFVSVYNVISITYHSDEINHGDGFELHWTAVTPECGKFIFVESHGTINSPGSPGNYPANKDCVWKLNTDYFKRIHIVFYSLQIENSTSCSADYLTILDEDGTTLEKLCGLMNPPPAPMVSATSSVDIHFHSNDVGSAAGFQLFYEQVSGTPGCGGILTEAVGEIKSPSVEDGKYGHGLFCEWVIQLPKKDKLKITFSKFSLEKSKSCNFDYLEVHDGRGKSAPLSGRWCGQNMPPVLYSSSNIMTVIFRTDWTFSAEGFALNYETVCGGIYTDNSGQISSPHYPDSYHSNINCIYLLAQPPGKAIKLSFLDFNLEDTYNDDICYFDYITIRDGDNENSTMIGQYCLAPPPDVIVSTHNYLWIKFQVDSSGNGRGFLANYSTIDIPCGGILKGTTGNIDSPSNSKNPSVYSSLANCKWVIIAPEGFVINLSWLTFSLETNSRCLHDYVEVFDNNTSPGLGGSLGKYCGKTHPPMMTSTSNIMTVVFKSDKTINYYGFTAHYISQNVSRVCGGNYLSSAGVITSLNYPKDYPESRECRWMIQVPPSQQIMLHIEDFKLEPHANCKFDYLEIRNGGYEHSPLIGRYCGTDIPKEITSHSNQLFLLFVSDVGRNYHGFKIRWDGSLTGCGGVSTSQSGSIISPNYPLPYVKNSECFYLITVAHGNRIQLTFVDIDLESTRYCLLDYLQIFDGVDNRAKVLGHFCNNHPSNLLSSKNHLYIKFRSDMSIQGRGFHVAYQTVCNVTFNNGFHGAIESPNFPNTYPRYTNCFWIIRIPKGNAINVTFSHFSLEPLSNFNKQSKCYNDYVELSENVKKNPQNKTLGKYCSNYSPPKTYITSSADFLNVHFYSDGFMRGKGFRMEWIIHGCGGVLSGNKEGRFQSPNYPNSYPHSVECTWLISVPIGHSIQITVNDIQLEAGYNCFADNLMIYSGPDDKSRLLVKLCSKKGPPPVYTTSGNYAYVTFKTDGSVSNKGFNASYQAVKSLCGGRFKGEFGTIHSLNYPEKYDKNMDCYWYIEVPSFKIVNLTFVQFAIQKYNKNCSNDVVEVYDGHLISDPVLLSSCGSIIPPTVLSTGNKILVRHRNNATRTLVGFEANFKQACGAHITANDQGYLAHSSSLTEHMYWEANCTWIITADPPDAHITLSLVFLNLGKSENGSCEDSSLSLYEGEDDVGEPIRVYCDSFIPPPYTSSSSKVLLKFRDHFTTLNQGFVLSYSVFSNECGGEIMAENGTIVSKNFPGGYPPNIECTWTLLTSPGTKMELQFTDFDLLEGSNNNCDEDYVEIREESASGKLLNIFCYGKQPTRPIIGSNLWIKFDSSPNNSSDVGSARGFSAEFRLLHHFEITDLTMGRIASPLYPMAYGNSETIFTWRIYVDFGSVIGIKFRDFYADLFGLVTPEGCLSYIEIFDGYDDSATRLLKHCGVAIPEPLRSTSNVVFVKFESSMWMRVGTKFQFDWAQETLDVVTEESISNVTGCGGSHELFLSANKSINQVTIMSPGYPNGYQDQLLCTWSVYTSPGSHISLKFLDPFGLEETPDCSNDYVDILSETTKPNDWKSLARVCKKDKNLNYDSISNRIKIVFHSDYYLNGSGFSVNATAECGGELTGPSGVIDTTNYASYHPRYLRGPVSVACSWNITVRPGRTIEVNFTRFDLPVTGTLGSNKQCKDTFIWLRNGENEHSPYLGDGLYCGKQIPKIPHTSSNHLHINYQADSKAKGIILTYREVSLNCDNEIHLSGNMSVNVSTPNYPNLPPPHSECIWIVSAPPGKSIHIDFIQQFDYGDCSDPTQYVELRDGTTELSPLIGRYCSQPTSYKMSSGNSLRIKFFTDLSAPIDSFIATVSLSRCGGTYYFANSGDIISPNYPESFPPNIFCNWRLVAPKSNIFHINFTQFNLGPYSSTDINGDCKNDTNTLSVTWVLPGIKVSSRQFDYMRLPRRRLKRYPTPNMPLYAYGYGSRNSSVWGNKTISDKNALQQNTVTFCGKIIPKPLQSPYNEVLLRFESKNPSIFKYEKHLFRLSFTHSERECGGVLTASKGVIKSPGYPNERFMNGPEDIIFCTWEITVARNRRVTLKILDFDLTDFSPSSPKTGTPYSGNVGIYNDANLLCKTEILYGRVSSGKTISSLTNKMFIRYGPFFGNNHKGFKAEYNSDFPILCGGILDVDYGFITSPTVDSNSTVTITNSKSDYITSYYCEWEKIFNSSYSHTMVFKISGTAGNSKYCSFLDSSIQFTTSEGKVQIDRICSTYTSSEPAVIVSPYRQTKILAQKVNMYLAAAPVNTSFNISYKTNPCGGELNLNRDVNISDPNIAGNIDCAWAVTTDEELPIKIHFISINMQSAPCDKQFIEFHNGPNMKSPTMAKFCGNSLPKDLITQTDKLWISYHSDDITTQKAKFKLTLSPVSDGCGGILHGSSDTIYSPGFPGNYPPNIECEWIINVQPGYHINLTFIERFHLELSDNCKNDSIEILDMKQPVRMIAKLCGRDHINLSYLSQSTQMKIIFRSNDKISGDGFLASWNINCGGMIPVDQKTIMSPNYPADYDNNLDCLYEINAPDKIITGFFLTFELEESANCKYDKLVINDGDPYCGKIKPPSVNSVNRLTLHFTTDKFTKRKGFLFEFIVDDCGVNITEPRAIKSPTRNGEVSEYLPDLNCVWNIIAPKSQIIIIRFTDFRLEYSSSCVFDSLTAYDIYPNGTESLIGKYCGNFKTLPVIKSSGNVMKLTFETDTTSHHAGFKGSVNFAFGPKDGCGGEITAPTDGVIIRPPDVNRDGQFESNLHCKWLIYSSSASHVLRVEFLSFKLNSNCRKKCACDYLEFHDGSSEESNFMGKYCDSNDTKIIITTTGVHLSMIFVSDSVDNSMPGFRVKISSVQTLCGNQELEVTDEAKELTSPSYPSMCTPGTHCKWFLKPKTGKTVVNFHFVDMDFERTADCLGDSLKIADNPFQSFASYAYFQRYTSDKVHNGLSSFLSPSPHYWSFCNRTLPQDLFIYDNSITVIFTCKARISDSKGSRFKLQYKTTGCSRNYTDEQANIFIKDSANSTIKECSILISAPNPNATVSLYFEKYTIHYDSCSNNRLEVYDGPNKSAKLISTICEGTIPDSLFSTGRSLFIFQYSVSARRILMTYTTTDKGRGCGGRLSGLWGSFSSPFFPSNLRNNSDCEWDVSVPYGNNIKLQFMDFDLGSRNVCNTDYLEIYDVDRETNEKFMNVKHCGMPTFPADYTGLTGHVIIHYKSSVHNTGTGWFIKYTSVRKIPNV